MIMPFTTLRKKLSNVVAIPATPFSMKNEIDVKALIQIIHHMTNNGISVITPNGNTGEYYSLSRNERKKCLEIARQAAPDAVILAGVGGHVENAVEEAVHAYDAGADAI